MARENRECGDYGAGIGYSGKDVASAVTRESGY